MASRLLWAGWLATRESLYSLAVICWVWVLFEVGHALVMEEVYEAMDEASFSLSGYPLRVIASFNTYEQFKWLLVPVVALLVLAQAAALAWLGARAPARRDRYGQKLHQYGDVCLLTSFVIFIVVVWSFPYSL